MKLTKYCLIFNFAFYLTTLSLHLVEYVNIESKLSMSFFGSIILGCVVSTDRFSSDYKRQPDNREIRYLVIGSLIIFLVTSFCLGTMSYICDLEFRGEILEIVEGIGPVNTASIIATVILVHAATMHFGFLLSSIAELEKIKNAAARSSKYW